MSLCSFLVGPSVFTRFVDFSVIKKGHTFINILALIHDYQGYSLVYC